MIGRSPAYQLGYEAGYDNQEKEHEAFKDPIEQAEYEEGHNDGAYERLRSQGLLRRA